MNAYTLGSLFSGIGGIDLAFQWAHFSIAFQVEIDGYCNQVLHKHWPDVPRFGDIRTLHGSALPRCDVLAGGFPCQDISAAGRGAGIRVGTRSGLWFEFARLIGELRPRVVLLENVAAITARDGTVVIGQLAEMGYVGRFGLIRASDAGAPHQRERWFCVAYAQPAERGADGARGCDVERPERSVQAGRQEGASGFAECGQPLADASSPRAGLGEYRGSGQGRQPAGTPESALVRQEHGARSSEGSNASCDDDVANAADARLSLPGCAGQPTGAAETGGGVESGAERCSELGHARREGLERRPGISGDDGTQQPPAERAGDELADAASGGSGSWGSEQQRQERSAALEQSGRRSTQPGVGREPHGLPAWLDGPDYTRWPARPGEPQHAWEPPRTVISGTVPQRAARLKALGNAVVPAVVYSLAVCIRAWLEAQDGIEARESADALSAAQQLALPTAGARG